MKALLKRYFNQLVKTFENNLRQVLSKGDKKSIHALRVTIKKLRAVFLFLEYLSPGSKTDSSKTVVRKLKKLFAEAGKLRTLEVHAALLHQYNKKDKAISGELKKLKGNIHAQRAHLKKKIKKTDGKELFKKLNASFKDAVATLDNKLTTKSIYDFAAGNIAGAIKLAKKESTHKARKKLKSAHYILEADPRNPKAVSLMKKIDPLEKETGKLHDHVIALQLLKKSVAKHKKSKSLRLMAGKIRQEMKTLDHQVKADFKELQKSPGGKTKNKKGGR